MTAVAPPDATPAVASARSFRSGRHGGWRELTANQLFLVPVAAVFLVLFVIPLGQSAYWSLTDFGGYSADVSFVGLKNYRVIFTDAAMLAGLTFTILYAVGTTALVTVLAVPLAVALNHRFFGRNLVRSVFFFPAVPSLAVLGLVWGYILSPLGSGVLNSVLGKLFAVAPVPWLSDGALARGSVIVVAVWAHTGWHAVLYLAYLQSIPGEFYEVATIDGASTLQQFRHITLPLLTPAIVISQFLLMTAGLKVFDLPYTLTRGGPGFATQTITQSIITSGVGQGEYGLASALAVVFTGTVAILSIGQLLVSRRIERRVT
jgi:multiple sugar transport system permease protein/raffinose/stachyose/melibiose transport system permease protein